MQTWGCYEVGRAPYIQGKKNPNPDWKQLGLGQTIYFHIICSFMPVTNVLRLCEASTKDGLGSIHSITHHTEVHMYSYDPMLMHVSPSPSCSLQCGQKAEVLGLLSCRLQSRLLFIQLLSLLRKAGLPCACQHMQSEAKEQWYQLRMWHLPLSTSSQNTQTSALDCCMQQTGVKHQLCVKLLTHIKNSSGQEPFFLLCICTMTSVSRQGFLKKPPFLKNTNSTLL